jgi:hypothetical protein
VQKGICCEEKMAAILFTRMQSCLLEGTSGRGDEGNPDETKRKLNTNKGEIMTEIKLTEGLVALFRKAADEIEAGDLAYGLAYAKTAICIAVAELIVTTEDPTLLESSVDSYRRDVNHFIDAGWQLETTGNLPVDIQ